MGKKLTYDYVKRYIENEGYELLSKEYLGYKAKLLVRCPNKHEYEVTYNDFQQKRRCPHCLDKINWDIEKVERAFKERGYTLLSTEYVNCKQKLDYACPNGHKHSITISKFMSGRGCPYCANDKMSEERRNDIEKIREKFKKEGYTLLTETYKNGKEILETLCPNGHIHKTSFNNFHKGQRCAKCYGKNIKYTYEQVKEIFLKEGYELLSTSYENCKQKIQYRCSNGHTHETTLDKFVNNEERCPYCQKSLSKGEFAINNTLLSLNVVFKREYVFKNCKDVGFLRFDFYIPTLNLCIEYDGEGHYMPIDWEGKGVEKAKETLEDRMRKDDIKTNFCNKNNINLLRIPYWEYDNIENLINQEIEKLKTFND